MKLERKIQLAETINKPHFNLCDRDGGLSQRQVGKQNKLHKQKFKQLAFYFLLYFIYYKCFTNFCKIPQEKFLLGFTNIRKEERQEEQFRASFGPNFSWVFFWQIQGSIVPSFCAQNLQKISNLLAGNYCKKTEQKVRTIQCTTQKFYRKNLNFKK